MAEQKAKAASPMAAEPVTAAPRRRRIVPSPAVLALRLENMRRGQRAKRRSASEVAAELGALDGRSLDEVRRCVSQRLQTVALLHIGGYSYQQIADALGYSQRNTVMRALRRPEVQRLLELVNEARYRAVIDGQYGARQAAQAASGAVVAHLVGLAGAAPPDTTGTRPGRATRDRDAIAAGQTVLGVAGLSVQRHEHRHVHQVLFEQMTEAELEDLATHGTWPTRLQGVVPCLPDPGPDEAGGR